MSERTTDVIRQEIADERRQLDADLAGLQSELRSTAVLMTAGLAVVALVTWRMGKIKGIRLLWKLAR